MEKGKFGQKNIIFDTKAATAERSSNEHINENEYAMINHFIFSKLLFYDCCHWTQPHTLPSRRKAQPKIGQNWQKPCSKRLLLLKRNQIEVEILGNLLLNAIEMENWNKQINERIEWEKLNKIQYELCGVLDESMLKIKKLKRWWVGWLRWLRWLNGCLFNFVMS